MHLMPTNVELLNPKVVSKFTEEKRDQKTKFYYNEHNGKESSEAMIIGVMNAILAIP